MVFYRTDGHRSGAYNDLSTLRRSETTQEFIMNRDCHRIKHRTHLNTDLQRCLQVRSSYCHQYGIAPSFQRCLQGSRRETPWSQLSVVACKRWVVESSTPFDAVCTHIREVRRPIQSMSAFRAPTSRLHWALPVTSRAGCDQFDSLCVHTPRIR